MAEERANQKRSGLVNEAVNQMRGMRRFGQEIPESVDENQTRVQDLVVNVTAREVRVLERVREQVPEQAKKGISRAIGNAQQQRDRIKQKVEDKLASGHPLDSQGQREDGESNKPDTM